MLVTTLNPSNPAPPTPISPSIDEYITSIVGINTQCPSTISLFDWTFPLEPKSLGPPSECEFIIHNKCEELTDSRKCLSDCNRRIDNIPAYYTVDLLYIYCH